MEELIDRAIHGDEDALTDLIILIEEDLYKIARTRLFCEDDIKDAVQETIIQTFKSIKKLREPKYFKTWIFKILLNKCNKIFRKSQKNSFVEYDEQLVNIGINHEDKIISELDFYNLIEFLNYNERIALILFYMEDLTTKEISEILEVPESTIRNRLSRARAKLKKKNRGGVYYG